MHWSVAVQLARVADDLTYQEWCSLYVSRSDPTSEQINIASMTAKNILVRNDLIKSSVIIDKSVENYIHA